MDVVMLLCRRSQPPMSHGIRATTKCEFDPLIEGFLNDGQSEGRVSVSQEGIHFRIALSKKQETWGTCECYAVVKQEYPRFPGRQCVLRTRVGRGKQILRADIALLVSRAA